MERPPNTSRPPPLDPTPTNSDTIQNSSTWSEEDLLAAVSSPTATPAAFAVTASNGKWIPFNYLLHVDKALVDVAAGRCRNLIVMLPSRHGKSDFGSKYFPSWFIGEYPDKKIILASYESDFAAEWGRKSRDVMEEFGPELFGVRVNQASSAANRWDIKGHAGGMRTAGVSGPITGKGADVLIIDDPIKNNREADSKNYRDSVWEWWKGTARDRLEPGGSVVIFMTRWHEDDLAGRLIKEQPEKWRVIRLPAIAEEDDPLGRAPGEALCPERYPIEELREIEKDLGPHWFAAKYQQTPRPREGNMFKHKWLQFVNRADVPMNDLRMTRFWDMAATSESSGSDPDWSVGLLLGEYERMFYILDVRRERSEPGEIEEIVRLVAEMDGANVRIVMEQEGGSAGKTVIQSHWRRILSNHTFKGERSTGSKVLRADPVSAAFARGHVKIVRADWNADFVSELMSFPKGGHDDQVDALSGAYSQLDKAQVRFMEI